MGILGSLLIPIHREGYRFIAIFFVVTLVLFYVYEPVGWASGVATLWCVYFFRDPDRVSPIREGLVLSPADGMVQMIRLVSPPKYLELGEKPRIRISVFMNIFNVHVNRVPTSGVVQKVVYVPGKFINASLDKASEHNERQAFSIQMPLGHRIGVIQIAGLIARRIVCHVNEGDEVRSGERFGIIRFGSRVDIYLEASMCPLVVAGQQVVAGETVIADIQSQEAERVGEVR